jgi:hypothetical protein
MGDALHSCGAVGPGPFACLRTLLDGRARQRPAVLISTDRADGKVLGRFPALGGWYDPVLQRV